LGATVENVAFLERFLVDRAKQCLKICALASAEISVIVVYSGSFVAEPKVDLDLLYVASLVKNSVFQELAPFLVLQP
jgi:hypothetical protein